jgi:hypothetical protein
LAAEAEEVPIVYEPIQHGGYESLVERARPSAWSHCPLGSLVPQSVGIS